LNSERIAWKLKINQINNLPPKREWKSEGEKGTQRELAKMFKRKL
jgi:hypothetical protein